MHKKIMIAIDDTGVARAAVVEGLEIARICNAEVVFFFVLPNYVTPSNDMTIPIDWSPEQHFQIVKAEAAKTLSVAAGHARRCHVKYSEVVGSGADAAECIAKAATAQGCDLIVVGSHGRTALQRLLHGSVVTRLITFAKQPVLVCKNASAKHVALEAVVPVRRKRSARRIAARANMGA